MRYQQALSVLQNSLSLDLVTLDLLDSHHQLLPLSPLSLLQMSQQELLLKRQPVSQKESQQQSPQE